MDSTADLPALPASHLCGLHQQRKRAVLQMTEWIKPEDDKYVQRLRARDAERRRPKRKGLRPVKLGKSPKPQPKVGRLRG